MNEDGRVSNSESSKVAIVDLSLGNLYSVKMALEHVGLNPMITSSKEEISKARAVVLPGVGAFGDAMNWSIATLRFSW